MTLDTTTFMVYAGMDHGVGQTDLNPKSRITFVQTAPNYKPADNIVLKENVPVGTCYFADY